MQQNFIVEQVILTISVFWQRNLYVMFFEELLMLFELFHQVSINYILVFNSHLLIGDDLSERIGLTDKGIKLLFIGVKCLQSWLFFYFNCIERIK